MPVKDVEGDNDSKMADTYVDAWNVQCGRLERKKNLMVEN